MIGESSLLWSFFVSGADCWDLNPSDLIDYLGLIGEAAFVGLTLFALGRFGLAWAGLILEVNLRVGVVYLRLETD